MADRLPVLTFHALEDSPSAICFPPRLFAWGLARLHEQGFRAIGLSEALRGVTQAAAFPDRALVITFDDGYQSVYRDAFPVLRRYEMPATIFLTVGNGPTGEAGERLPELGGRAMLSWGEIREMQAGGISFGAHTLTHPNLTRIPPEQAEQEMVRSRALIEDRLGRPAADFAYPFGRFNPAVQELARRHFSCACTDHLDLMTGKSDPFALERVDAYYLRSPGRWKLLSTRALAWYLRARRGPRRIRRAWSPDP